MNIQYEYEERLNGAKLVAIGDQAFAVNSPTELFDHGTFYSVNKNDYVIGTGICFMHLDTLWAQTRIGMWVNASTTESGAQWQAYEGAASKVSYSRNDAQKYVNQIINCNKQIIANNILCARFSNKLTSEQKAKLYELQKRLEARNNSLLNDGFVSDVTTSYPQGYAELQSYLNQFMASGGVGSVTVTIVVAAIVIASLSTAAYFAYKYYAQEAERDVKYSKELTAVLTSKLTDAEYQQLLEETKGIVTKSKIRASLSSYSSLIGITLMAAGALLIYKKLR